MRNEGNQRGWAGMLVNMNVCLPKKEAERL
jgi:hypothetical protein